MLPPFIIEHIRQREEERERRKHEENRPRLELPLERYPAPRRPGGSQRPDPSNDRRPDPSEEDDPNRGVIILEIA